MSENQDMSVYEKKCRNGDIIIKTGDKGNEFYYIISGKAGVYINYGQQNQLKVAELAAGEFFGEGSIIGNTVRSATIISIDNTVLDVIPLDNITLAIQEHPEIFLNLIKNSYTKQSSQNKDLMRISALIEEMHQTNEETIKLNTKIIDCLNEIQAISQTNTILGLNASIEAARVGTAGKSFAVIAQELQSLSAKTSATAKQSQALVDECKKNSVASAEKFNSAKEFLKKFR